MTNSVSITETNNTVTVNETTNEVTVTQGVTSIATVVSEGPQGAVGPQGPPVSEFYFDGSAKVDKSVVYYDSTAGKFKADNTWTTSTLVFGGDF